MKQREVFAKGPDHTVLEDNPFLHQALTASLVLLIGFLIGSVRLVNFSVWIMHASSSEYLTAKFLCPVFIDATAKLYNLLYWAEWNLKWFFRNRTSGFFNLFGLLSKHNKKIASHSPTFIQFLFAFCYNLPGSQQRARIMTIKIYIFKKCVSYV